MSFGQRVDGFVFRVEDPDGFDVGEIHPVVGATIELQTTRAVMRTMTGLTVTEKEFGDINPARHRIRPYAVVDGVEWPLGVFRFATDSVVHIGHRHTGEDPTGENTLDGNLADLSMTLDQSLGVVLSVTSGTVESAIATLLYRHAPPEITTTMVIDGNSAKIGAQSWPPETHLLQAINDLCTEHDYYPAFFDRSGILRIRRQVDVADADPVVDWSNDLVAEGVVVTRNYLMTPTRWVVISSNEDSGPVVGEYRLPADHPMSSVSRGFEVTKTISTQGITSQTQAAQIAASEASVDPDATESLAITGILDPRHDVFDPVAFDGRMWLERSWTMELRAGGVMNHICDRQLVTL